MYKIQFIENFFFFKQNNGSTSKCGAGAVSKIMPVWYNRSVKQKIEETAHATRYATYAE